MAGRQLPAPSTNALPRASSAPGNALHEFLAQTAIHEEAAPLPPRLVRYALVAAIWTLIVGFVGLAAASVAPAVPVVFIPLGLGLLAGAFYLRDARGERARRLVTVQLMIGGIAPALTVIAVALLALFAALAVLWAAFWLWLIGMAIVGWLESM
jgi:hypothetical protein